MTNKPGKSTNFWEELKRRKVVRVITVYAAAAFVIIELTNNITEPLSLPDWVPTLVIVLLAIGFLIAIVMSWIFDITPEGVKKTKPIKEVQKAEKKVTSNSWKIATYVSVLIIVGFVAFYVIDNIKQSSDISKLEKSIAVLPFENWSYEEEYSHYGNAIANEIITELYKIRGFRVLSHTSTLQYIDSKKSIPAIGQELGVNYIIEGIIERQGNKVNIHVQVIRAKNEDHIWAEEFDGEWKDIFKIQDDIAFKVADELKTVLSPNEIESIERKPTENMAAYDYYLRGNDFNSRSFEERDWTIAINLYQKSIELDSTFALPYAMLAKAYLSLYWFHYDRSNERLKASKEIIDVALNLDPDLGETYIALGLYYYWGFLDYNQALKQFLKALEYIPDNVESNYYMGCVNRRMGNWEKAIDYFLKTMQIDPRHLEASYNMAGTLLLLGEYSRALDYFNAKINSSPEFAEAYRYKIDLYLKWEGNTKNARKTLEETSLIINPSLYTELIEKVVLLDIFDGNYQNALDYLNKVNFEAVQPQFYYYPKSLYYAWIYDLMEDPERASHFYNLSQLQIEEKLLENPDDSRLFSSLGICYAGLDQKDKALLFGKKGVDLLPIIKESWRGYFRSMELAQIYVMVGEYQLAIEQLDFLLSIPGELSSKLLQLDPKWKPLWDLPDFKQLIEKYSDN